MTTATALVERARRMVIGSQRDRVNVLTTTLDSDDPTVVLNLDTADITPGQYIEIDFELMLVVERTSTSLSVIRAMDGSTAAAHTSGALVRSRPILSNFDLYQSMQEELADLSSPLNGLYQVIPVTITPSSSSNLTDTGATGATATSIVRARVNESAGQWTRLNARLERGMNIADYPSGVAVRIDDWTMARPVRVWLRAPFGALTPGGTVETDTGLHPQATDILAVGAAYRSLVGREMARSLFETQGDTRRANEVPPGAQRQGLTPFAVLRRQRIDAEKTRLDAEWTD